ncbi:MAG: hypothetical protein IIU24_09225, partial [Selenomonas sp.]|nr:hypothetical protein [Selenomonas sp.]
TQASAAGTLSAIIFIIPGMLMIGYWQDFAFWQTLLVSACGGGSDSRWPSSVMILPTRPNSWALSFSS